MSEPGVYPEAPTRIRPNSTVAQTLVDLAEDDMSAVLVLSELYRSGEIDPDSVMGGLGALMLFDRLGLYGPAITTLYKSLCDSSPVRTLAVLRATQLGLVDGERVRAAVDWKRTGEGPPATLDVDQILADVRGRLKNFARVP